MSALGVYEVVGRRAFRGHQPGCVFEARLDSDMESRAIHRGSIRLLERLEADLPKGNYRLPAGWPMTERKDDG